MARRTGRAKAILFRISYSTTFTLVFLTTIGFTLAGPIDTIYQSWQRNRLLDVFTIAGIYFFTGLIAVLLYAARLYTNRQLLKDIPKTYMPIDKSELGNRRVGRLIEDCRNRANVVGYLARPRARRVEQEVGYAGARIRTLLKPEHSKESRIFEPQWGTISHPGWSNPAAPETPNLDYSTVVSELTDLIEARAVSLAPVDPSLGETAHSTATVDEYIIEALRRPQEQGMRGYISQLISLDVLDNNSLVVAFQSLYERARFAPNPLAEDEFKQLMRMFAEILRTMKPLNVDKLDLADPLDDDDDDDDDTEEPAPSHPHHAKGPEHPSTTTTAARNAEPQPSTTSSSLTTSSSSSMAGSVRHHSPAPLHQSHNHTQTLTAAATTATTFPSRISHDSVRSLSSQDHPTWTAPTSRPPFFRAHSSQSRTSTHSHSTSIARPRITARRRSRVRRAMSRASVASVGESLRSVKSSGSVIRLNPRFDGSEEMLPFEYVTRGSGDDGGDDGGGNGRRQVVQS